MTLEILVFEAMFYFGIIAAVVILLLKLIKDTYIKHTTKYAEVSVVANQLSNGARGALAIEYAKNIGGSYVTEKTNDYLVYEAFIQKLKEYFTVDITYAYCSDKIYCNYMLKLVGKKGNTFFIIFNTTKQNVYNAKKEVKFVSDIAFLEMLDENDEFIMCTGVEYVRGAALAEDNEDLVALEAIINDCEISYRAIEEDEEYSHRVYRFVKKQGQYSLVSTEVPVGILRKSMLDSMYSPMEVEFENSTYEFKAGDAVRIACDSILAGSHLFLHGVMGGGKTSYASQVAARLSKRRDVNIVMLSPSILRELQHADAQYGLLSAFAESTREGFVNVLVVDEAEALLKKAEDGIHTEDASFVLQLLSGDIGKQLNLRMIMTFNAEPNMLNDKLFRAGRKGLMFNVKPLKETQARELIEHIKVQIPEREFCTEKFEKTLSEENCAVSGIVYAEAGEITLADVYDCFVPRSTATIIRQILEREKGESEPFTLGEVKLRRSIEDAPSIVEALPAPSPQKSWSEHKKGKKHRHRNK